MQDNSILDLFFSRSEQALSEVQKKYGALCKRIAYNILENHEDADEAVNTAYMRAWNAIPPARPASLCGYLCAAVRNTALNAYDSLKRRRTDELYDELSEIIPDEHTVESEFECRQISGYISEFLRKQTKTNSDIFMARYYYSMALRDIGNALGLTESSVKMRLMRTRKALAKYLKERGVDV